MNTLLERRRCNMANHQRILAFENGFNFRDLGGYRTIDGESLKWNNLVRSAHLSYLHILSKENFMDMVLGQLLTFVQLPK